MKAIKKEDVQLFLVADDDSGELKACKDLSQQLEDNRVYLLVNEVLSKTFIWIGSQAGVRSKFVAAQAAQNIRTAQGLTHRVVAVDQGQEPTDFVISVSPIVSSDQFELQTLDTVSSKPKVSSKRKKRPPKAPRSTSGRTVKRKKIPIIEISDDPDIQLFQVTDDESGELKVTKDPSELSKGETVFLLINDTLARIFLWIGANANVRRRFIGARAAQTMQRTRGLHYRVVAVDQGQEPVDFSDTLSQIVSTKQLAPRKKVRKKRKKKRTMKRSKRPVKTP